MPIFLIRMNTIGSLKTVGQLFQTFRWNSTQPICKMKNSFFLSRKGFKKISFNKTGVSSLSYGCFFDKKHSLIFLLSQRDARNAIYWLAYKWSLNYFLFIIPRGGSYYWLVLKFKVQSSKFKTVFSPYKPLKLKT